MRILVVSDLPQFVTGGAEMQAARLIEEWTRAGHEVICLGRRMGAQEARVGEARIRVHRIRTIDWLGRPGRALSYFLSLAWLAFRFRRWAQVAYCRFLGDAAVSLCIASKLGYFAAPIVSTPAHAGPTGDVSYLRSVPGTGAIIRLLDRELAAVNLIAPGMMEDLRLAGFGKVRISTIPNGVPLAPLRRPQRAPGPLRVLTVGRLAHQKGYDILVDALALLPPEAQGRLQVEVAGDGPLREALQARAAGLAPGLLHFLGELDAESVQRRLEHSDLFLLSSRYEGMSNAALEAMERGLPLLVTRCGGIDTYLGEGAGWVVAPGDARELAAALLEVLELPLDALARAGAASRELAEARFSLGGVAARYLQLFQELIDASGRGRPQLQ